MIRSIIKRFGRLTSELKFKIYPRIPPNILSRRIVSKYTTHLYGPADIKCGKNDLIVLSVMRNASDYIKPFIDYYLNLGVKHIVLLDNDSSDNSIIQASRYPNVTIFGNKLPFRYFAWVFKPFLIDRFGKNNWFLCVDIDEFFDYPFSDKLSLKSFLNYLNKYSYNAVIAQMLDMFSGDSISKPFQFRKYPSEQYKYYDISRIKKTKLPGKNIISNRNIKFHTGGIRSKIFHLHKIFLTKCPLINLGNKLKADDFAIHHIKKNAYLADISCILYHYKLTGNLYKQSIFAIKEKNYVKDSYQYKRYYEILTKHPHLNIKKCADTSELMNNKNKLIKQKFMMVSNEFIRWTRFNKKR